MPVDNPFRGIKRRLQLSSWYRPEILRGWLWCMQPCTALQRTSKKQAIGQSLQGKDDPGGIISGVCQQGDYPATSMRLGWGVTGWEGGVTAHPPARLPFHLDASEPRSPAKETGRACFLFVWLCARACLCPSNSIGLC